MLKFHEFPVMFDTDENGGAGNGSGSTESPVEGQETESQKPSNENSGTIDWSKIDSTQIPEDVIRKHPAYNQVKEEAIQRRKENTRLKKALASDEEGGEHSAAQTPNESEVDISKLSPFERLMYQKMQALEQSTAQTVAEANWVRVKTEFDLEDDDREFIRGTTYDDMSKSAKKYVERVGKNKRQYESSPAGDGSVMSPTDSFRARMQARMSGKSGMSNPFDVGLHRQRG